MTFATFLTLVVTPTLYSLLEDLTEMKKSVANRLSRLVSKPAGSNGGITNEGR